MPVDQHPDEDAPVVGQLRPRALIVTIYGLYARDVGGWFSVATLIRLMAQLGVDETAVRSSISRLKRRGIIQVERVDGAAGYSLSSEARHILELGDSRIFERSPARLADGWVLAVFSVPESERHKRHLLRTRLTSLGFGTVGPGVWIAPSYVEGETLDALVREGLDQYVDLFQSNYRGFRDLVAEVASWWDLDELDRLYRGFQGGHAPMLAEWRKRRRKDDDGEAFADWVRTLTQWRRLPFLDPGLPAELLPRSWSGADAAETFTAIRRRLEGSASRFVASVRRP